MIWYGEAAKLLRSVFLNCDMQQGVKHTIKTNGSYYMTMTVVDWADVFIRSSATTAELGELVYDLENGGLLSTTENLGIANFVQEYHTTGIHSGKISTSKINIAAGFTYGAILLGIEGNIEIGLEFPNTLNDSLK